MGTGKTRRAPLFLQMQRSKLCVFYRKCLGNVIEGRFSVGSLRIQPARYHDPMFAAYASSLIDRMWGIGIGVLASWIGSVRRSARFSLALTPAHRSSDALRVFSHRNV